MAKTKYDDVLKGLTTIQIECKGHKRSSKFSNKSSKFSNKSQANSSEGHEFSWENKVDQKKSGFTMSAADPVFIGFSHATDILFCCVFLKSQLLYFSTDSYVVTIRWNRLSETIPTNGHYIGIGRD